MYLEWLVPIKCENTHEISAKFRNICNWASEASPTIVSRSQPFPFYYVEEGKGLELPVLAFTQSRVGVNWFEVSGQPMSL